jgi:hypothetical protein
MLNFSVFVLFGKINSSIKSIIEEKIGFTQEEFNQHLTQQMMDIQIKLDMISMGV